MGIGGSIEAKAKPLCAQLVYCVLLWQQQRNCELLRLAACFACPDENTKSSRAGFYQATTSQASLFQGLLNGRCEGNAGKV